MHLVALYLLIKFTPASAHSLILVLLGYKHGLPTMDYNQGLVIDTPQVAEVSGMYSIDNHRHETVICLEDCGPDKIGGGLDVVKACECECPAPKVPIRDEDDMKCSICLEVYKKHDFLHQLPCGHRFHTGCVRRALDDSMSCPQCTKGMIWVLESWE